MPNEMAIVRYGIKWNGPREPIGTPMVDGYWTPWHIANAEIERLRAEVVALQSSHPAYGDPETPS